MEKRVLSNIQPKEVLYYFEDLTQIPRCSGKEEQVVEYLINYAEKHNFEWTKDEKLNVLIKKPATKGMESRPTIILQAHSDMVCEKNRDTRHDFDKDPIKLDVHDDKIIAENTTLGADNGIGLAIALAFMSKEDTVHPAIEFICTSDEERGLKGAEQFDMNLVEGKTLINLDGNDHDIFAVGCAGGPVVKVDIPLEMAASDTTGKIGLDIKLTGLTGGHSGEDIHRERGNSIKLMARLLQALNQEVEFDLQDIRGGVQYNAIPRESYATVLIKKEDMQKAEKVIENYSSIYKNEYRNTEPHLTLISKEEADVPNESLLNTFKHKLIDFLYFCDNGVIRKDSSFPDLIESSINVGTIILEKNKAVIQIMARSSVKSVYTEMYNKIVKLTEHCDGSLQIMSDTPAWEYDPNSELRGIFREVYEESFNETPEFLVLHAGLECGVFAKNTERKMDMITAGPKLRNLHTPGEYVSISSLQKFWIFFQRVMKEIY